MKAGYPEVKVGIYYIIVLNAHCLKIEVVIPSLTSLRVICQGLPTKEEAVSGRYLWEGRDAIGYVLTNNPASKENIWQNI